mgnify:CR=1 FL=1|tara:strand:+ start:6491 stop:6646 length:156 start_codon:yes stop_codon:yes gene_type:complete
MAKEVWETAMDKLLVVEKVDAGLYFYEYAFGEFLLLEKSPTEYKMIYVGEL